MACIILADGSRVDSAKLVGNGADGFVIRYGDHVMKIPNLLGHLQPSGEIEAHVDNDLYRESLEAEKEVYKRLQHVPGVAECLGCTTNGIRLRYYPNGSLHELITRRGPPPMSWRRRWVLQATDIIARCHERGVLVLDIALRNFLLTDEFDLRIIDFANSSLVSRDADITKANIDGGTALLDLLYLSTVIYSILTWQDFSTHCFDESEWPSADTMPDLAGLAFAPVIRKCWLRKYTCIQDLACEIRQYAVVPSNEPLDHHALVFAPPRINVRSSSSDSPPERGQLKTMENAPLSTNPLAWWAFVLPVVTGGLRSLVRWLALGAAKLSRLAF
ncbi:uncharacterized protein RCC_01555 [Ramularia collo-cygni]|uniref:Protein kinase domain-containing protein n=1 Tax=Ramularia collo-cygni TaxID=112498 RepID=A0A2D3UMU2_9PEZI|nr:uncharacterized protein RCC_01555 [Ramularia collo-cygni]CZT15721.1 uncharacterized protein RCC_01555 [Ramularia collo-cygni]